MIKNALLYWNYDKYPRAMVAFSQYETQVTNHRQPDRS
jgi:hypothetical protein